MVVVSPSLVLYCSIFSCLFVLIIAQQRWYLTGYNENTTKPKTPFLGQTVTFNDICGSTNNFQLFFGGVFSRNNSNATIDAGVLAHMEQQLGIPESGTSAPIEGTYRELSIEYNSTYDIFGTVDYETSYGFEVGLFDHQTATFSDRFYRHLMFGRMFCFSAIVSVRADAEGESISSKKDVTAVLQEHHQLVYSIDMRKRVSLMSHVWRFISPATPVTDAAATEREGDKPSAAASSTSNACKDSLSEDSAQTNGIPLRVMTYNLWHNNPASWVFSVEERLVRYEARLRHFAGIILDEFPDVALIQEVRLDSNFNMKLRKTAPTGRSYTTPVGGQVEHLLYTIDELCKERQQEASSPSTILRYTGMCGNGKHPYQIVYQPAMLLQEIDPRSASIRNEEGVAILVKKNISMSLLPLPNSRSTDDSAQSKVPVSAVDYRLLPRFIEDPNDGHQRALLHVRFQLSLSESGGAASQCMDGPVIDIYTVHYSLSERTRDLGVIDSWNFIYEQSASSDVQILGGDFNAEPEEPAMQYLAPTVIIKKDSYSINSDNIVTAEVDTTGASVPAERILAVEPRTDAAANPICSSSYHHKLQRLRAENTESSMPCPDFVDSWLFSQPSTGFLEKDGFTFPACNPIKRIDYLFVRNSTAAIATDNDAIVRLESRKPGDELQWRAHIKQSTVVGKRPTPETEHWILDNVTGAYNPREGLGMLDKDSPVWASDHFGLVTDLFLVPKLWKP